MKNAQSVQGTVLYGTVQQREVTRWRAFTAFTAFNAFSLSANTILLVMKEWSVSFQPLWSFLFCLSRTQPYRAAHAHEHAHDTTTHSMRSLA